MVSANGSTTHRRSYRDNAVSYLKGLEEDKRPLEPCEQWSSTVSSPQKNLKVVASTTSRCRSRTPSPPHSSATAPISTSSSSSMKAPRSVSPGGTAASSAGEVSRGAPSSVETQLPPPQNRGVRWATTLVSSVKTRPRTLRKDVAMLFYSRADEKRFRREAEFAVPDDDWAENLDEDSLGSLSDDDSSHDDTSDHEHKGLFSKNRDHRKDYGISKAVVVFGEATKTYGTPSSCAVEAATQQVKALPFSFDDAAFWNGQLTWS